MTQRQQLHDYIEMTVYGYLNGCVDAGYEPMTEDGWVEYVWTCLAMDKDTMVNGQEFKHLYFCGREKIEAETRKFVRADEWAREWTKEA